MSTGDAVQLNVPTQRVRISDPDQAAIEMSSVSSRSTAVSTKKRYHCWCWGTIWNFMISGCTWFWNQRRHVAWACAIVVAAVLGTLGAVKYKNTCVLSASLTTWSVYGAIVLLSVPATRVFVKIVLLCVRKLFRLNDRVMYYANTLKPALFQLLISIVAIIGWYTVMGWSPKSSTCPGINRDDGEPFSDVLWTLFAIAFGRAVQAIVLKNIAESIHGRVFFERLRKALLFDVALRRLLKKKKRRHVHRSRDDNGSDSQMPVSRSTEDLSTAATTTDTEIGAGASLASALVENGLISAKSATPDLIFASLDAFNSTIDDVKEARRRARKKWEDEMRLRRVRTKEHQIRKRLSFGAILDTTASPSASTSDGYGITDPLAMESSVANSVFAVQTEELFQEQAATKAAEDAQYLMTAIFRIQARNQSISDPTTLGTLSHDHFRKLFSEQADLADFLFAFFAGDQEGRISEQLITNGVTRATMASALEFAILENKYLHHGLTGATNLMAIAKLATSAIMSFLYIVIGLTIFGVDVTQVLLASASFLVAFTFLLGSLLKNVIENVYFLFVTRPFDEGDKIKINDQVYTVKRIHLSNTEMLMPDNTLRYYPNSQLINVPIDNSRRSPHQWDMVVFDASMETQQATFDAMRDALFQFTVANPADYYPGAWLEITECEQMNRYKCFYSCRHRDNFQDRRQWRRRRTKMILEFARLAKQMQLSYSLPQLPVAVTKKEHVATQVQSVEVQTGEPEGEECVKEEHET